MTTENQDMKAAEGVIEHIHSLADQVTKGELDHGAAIELLQGIACPEADIFAIVEQVRPLIYSEPEFALALAQLSHEAATQIDSVLGQALCAFQIGTIYKARGQYHEAVEQYRESLTLFEEREDSHNVCAVLTQLGAIYIHLGQHETAHDYLERGLAISQQHGYRAHEGVQLGNLGTIELIQSDYPQAETYL